MIPERMMGRSIVIFLLIILAPFVQAQVGDYRVAPGDVLAITVFGEPDLSVPEVRVPANGAISYPLLGEVIVANLTASELEQQMTGLLLDGYLRNPRVTVTILQYRPFYVRGEVKEPGAHSYAEGLTVDKALVLAGGPLETADLAAVGLLREGDSDNQPDLVTHSALVQPGDILTVPSLPEPEEEQEEQVSYIYLYGEVTAPGSYEYHNGLTVEKAIALAGGFAPRASKRKIKITREADPPQTLKRVELREPVMPGDVITVGASLF
ncbi:MAG: SLBB domain-containing protein [Gammaproteobacteria bacterium]|nr:SLBB domain-containing protein [Gammaproteobacteria bacterium]